MTVPEHIISYLHTSFLILALIQNIVCCFTEIQNPKLLRDVEALNICVSDLPIT